MGEFLYRAIDLQGVTVAGVTEATSLEYARRNLQKAFRHVIEIKERPDTRAMARSVGTQALLIYTQQLAAMIEAGVPITRALEILLGGDNPRMNAVIQQLSRSVMAGRSLSSAMSDFPTVFPRIYTSLVASAEASGKLHTVLGRLVILLEREASIKKKLLATFSYPVCLIFLATSVCSLIVFYIFPVLKPMFSQVGMELPPLTLAMIKIADAFKHPLTWLLIASALGGCYYLFRLLRRGGSDVPGGARYTVDLLLLHVPVLGRLISQSVGSRVLFAMAMMLDAGINLMEVLRLLDDMVGNACLRHGLAQTRKTLSEGVMFVEALTKHQVFADGALQMLRAGEESGKLDEMMKLVALNYEQDMDLSLDRLSATLEPLIMSVMGVVIGFICIASLLPVLKFVQQI